MVLRSRARNGIEALEDDRLQRIEEMLERLLERESLEKDDVLEKTSRVIQVYKTILAQVEEKDVAVKLTAIVFCSEARME